MRLFNEKTGEWSIYWSTRGSGEFAIPTVGRFKDGIGTFYDREFYNGQPIVVRFTWTKTGDSSRRWEQAFSNDDGVSWEVNWIMELSRHDA